MRRTAIAITLLVAVAVAACGDDDAAPTTTASVDTVVGVALVPPGEAADVVARAPEGLVVLDIRTPEEWDEFRLADSVLVDFYEPDFADRVAALDRDVPYVMYCNSGNRSAAAAQLMRDLGFSEVYEIAGGIQAWRGAGFPTAP